MTLTKDMLVSVIKDRLDLNSANSRKLLEELLEIMKNKLEAGEELKISNFGKWTTRSKRARLGRNPNTGDRLTITPRKVVTFHPSTKLRDLINGSHKKDDVEHLHVAS